MYNNATWIWYPGDFEIDLMNKVCLRRTERGIIIPPFWRMDSFYQSLKFYRSFEFLEDEKVYVYTEGNHNIMIDGKYFYGDSAEGVFIQKGQHEMIISVVNLLSPPAIFVYSKQLISDNDWQVSCNNHEWPHCASWNFNAPCNPPSGYKLNTVELNPLTMEKVGGRYFIDFGKELFGYIKLNGITGSGEAILYYGESLEEAKAGSASETFDVVYLNSEKYIFNTSKAFRYIVLDFDQTLKIESVSALYEYLPVEYRGKFRCSDDLVNQIWDTSVYTLHLNTRELFLDGIKRDRWVWSGDAYQSYLMNYYTFFDEAVNRRTMLALRGKDPVETHINHIMDYSFYWILGLYDHYMYTGDINFIKAQYPKALTLMAFCLKRRNEEGMMEGLRGDWVFVDWADDLDKTGEVCFEQILLCKSYEVMKDFAKLMDDHENYQKYHSLNQELYKKIMDIFWDESLGGFVQNRVNGMINKSVTKHANMFAILFDIVDEAKKERIKKDVLLNQNTPLIKTPYMRFYELSSLCEIHNHSYVLNEIKAYWGGMLKLEATSFWEEYDPKLNGAEHYQMYDRPFGKSLCHAWGASPVYLLGKYFLGVTPKTPGYGEFMACPVLGSLEWMEGTVPTPMGDIYLYMDTEKIKIKSTKNKGLLRFKSNCQPDCNEGTAIRQSEGYYLLDIEPMKEYNIRYS